MQNRDICNEFRWAFSDWHQKHYGYPVEIDYLTPGGTSDVKRQLDSIYRSIRAAHGGQLPPESQTDSGIQLAWGGGDQFFEHELKPIGILRPLDLTQSQLKEIFPQPVLAGSNLYDQQRDPSGKFLPPRWVGVCLSSFGIVYNQDLCSALGVPAPTTWNALADPRLVGAVALADPTHSGTASVMYMIILQRAMADAEEQFLQSPANAGKDPVSLKKTPEYQSALDTGWKRGMQTLTLIAANARYFDSDSQRVPTDVSLGDSAMGTAIDFYGRVTEETVGPQRIQFVAPKSATASNPDPIAILYGTQGQKLTLANHLIEFMLSPQGQCLWILRVGQPNGPREHALRRAPVRMSVYADRTGWADDINYFAQAGNFALRPQWMASMPILRPIWAAAWIDDGEDLRSAYRKILALPDPARRAKLLTELADLPITRAEVDHPTPPEKTTDPDLARATQRLNWAKKFLAHYHKVAGEAEAQ